MRVSFVSIHIAVQIIVLQFAAVNAFSSHRRPTASLVRPAPLLRQTNFLASITVSEGGDNIGTSNKIEKLSPAEEKRRLIRKEGGPFAFNTKFGALNPYAIYYGLTSILLGIPWFLAMLMCQFFYFITGNRIDRNRSLPIRITQMWGTTLLTLTGNWPKLENRDILLKFYKEKRPAMFVANHNSWMDIPFLGAMVGWRNYKLVSKKELAKVPILGKAIKVGGNLMLDRTDKRDQIRTLKKGIQVLKNGVHLCTFPEGTRSKSGRLGEFKNGAFMMAHKAGAPIIPVSIVGAANVMPGHWMFPCRPGHNVARMVIHKPVESVGKTEAELAAEVRRAMILGLPGNQRPLDE